LFECGQRLRCARGWAATAILIVTVAALDLAAPAASARTSYEPTEELATGSLIYGSFGALVTEREDLVVGLDKIQVTYLIRNAGSHDRTTTIVFPLPDIDMAALDGAAVAVPAFDPQNPTNFIGFWALLDGKAVAPHVDVRAKALGWIDVSSTLTSLGLPLYPLDPAMEDKLAQLKASTRADLAVRGIVNLVDGVAQPLWTLRTAFHWPVTFPFGKLVTIQLGYRPVIGSALWTTDNAEALVERFCVDKATADALTAKAAADEPVTVYWVHYQPGKGAALKGPSARFNLTIEKPDVSSITATCRQGLKPGTPLTLELSTEDSINDEDINVLFVE
jgi:hypothetical protein